MIGKKVAQLRLVVLTVSMLLIQFVAKSQIEVSVPFDDGFIGLVGSNRNTAVLAAGTSGNVSVTNPGGTGVLAGFTFIPTPVITSFSPASGPVGTLVTITGTNLETPTDFTIGGIAAIVISNTGTSLVGMVMPGAATGTISLTTAGGSATSAATFTLSAAPPPNTQQGAKLVGTGISGSATLGYSVSLSADGTTAIVGGYNDNSFRGAAWIYTRSGATWSQEGAKLVGTGGGNFTSSQAVNNSRQGFSVSISADGNTAIVGGYSDNSNRGAVWFFTRSGTTWSQQGNKLVGTGATGFAQQGYSVSISADGNTAIVGGFFDNSSKGAAWIYTRSGSTWTQQGNKLVGTGATGNASQGHSVSLSADGNTAIVGGISDNSGKGAAWIYTRSGSTWTQQGAKLVGTGAIGNANQGRSVSLSADGTTAVVGGTGDNSYQGAAWIYTRSGTTWTQQGPKLVGTGAVGNAEQGRSVSLSADGNTAIVGGYFDNTNQGAAWIYTRNGTTWNQLGDKLVGTGAVGNAYQGHGVSLSADGTTAMVGGGSDNSSQGAVWVYNYVQPPAPTITSFAPTSAVTGATVTITGTNFTGATAVSFGGTAATSYTVVSSTSITAVLAAGTSGNVSVTTWGGTAVLAGFTFIPTPVITSFTPTSAATGATVTLTGTDFTGATAVSFGGTAATSFNVVSATSITAVVAAGASGNVSVTTPGGTGVLAGFTFFPAPVITSFTPTSAATGATVTLTGTDFTGATAVSFGGIAATSFNVVSATSITAVVSALGASGNVSVTTPGGTAVLAGFTFPPPVITSFSPSSGPVGTLVTITGTNLGTPTAFTIGGATAIVISNTGTSLVGMVMPGAASGTISLTTASGSVTSATTFTVSAASAPNTQQGTKLVGTGNTGAAGQGYAVSISADGTIAIVGGLFDNFDQGAAWIYTRSGTTWTQQGDKLVGTGAVGTSQQGVAVSLSADGNTAIVGGNEDDGLKGAAWIFTRSGATWTQQGAKLVGTGAIGTAQQGRSVSLSADGNTAIVGGSTDNSSQGAVWIFTRSGTTWTQQGAKLVGTGNTGAAQQGRSVSLSADGNTAILGGYFDNTGQGAVWIFTRSGTTWTQQGAKLVGTGAVGAARQGQAVSLSADGTTAIVGGNADNFTTQGAAWIFTRSGTTWTQQGTKIVGTGYTGAAAGQGWAVSLSADGNTAILGGYADNSDQGAAWIFTRSGTTWTQQGNKLVGTGAVGAARQGWAVSLSADGTTAILGGYADNSDQGAVWAYNYVPPAPTITSFTPTSAITGATVTLTGTNFTGATAVSFGGTTATSFNVVSATSITAVLAAGTSGDVSVTTLGGTGVLAGFTFIPAPTITSSTYNASTGVLVVTGTNLVATAGATNDIDVSKLSLTGEGGSSYTLTTSNVELTNATSFSITLNATDIAAVNQILNKNGTSSTGSTTYIIVAADNWNPAMTGSADLTGNAVIVSDVAVPTITSATYDIVSGSFVVTGTNLLNLSGATNDIDVTKLTFTGQGASTFTLTSNTTNVEITNGTSFTVSLGATDKTSINALLNKNGTSSIGGTTYNLTAAEDWNAGADPAEVIADLTGNGITVSNVATITTTGTLAALTTIYATASSNTSFSVSGASLTNDIIVTAPTGFEVSVSTTSGFGNTVTLTQTSGTVSITTVYVRLKSNSTVAGSPYSGDVTCTSTNAQTVNVATVSSTVTALGLTVTGVTANNKEYDANTTATLVGTPTLVGVETADQANVTLAGTATATFNNASVGTSKTVTVTGYILGGTAAGNYTVSQPIGLTANIIAKAANTLTIDPIANQTFTGLALTPAIVVKNGATTLTLGTHYSVAYSNNTNVGTATVTITGIGNYSGTKTATFSIVAKAASTLTIDPIANQTYTGSALTPSLVVKDGVTTLTLGTHYTVTYSNNTNVGAASVMITGMGNYTGTKTGTFSIFIPGPTAVVCCSDLAGTYAFDALQTFCGKPPYSGSITLTAVAASPGSYTVSDGSFGAWANCYPDTWGSGNVRINDNCGNLTMSGKDKYGDSYSMTVKSVTPALLTFEWRNTYGEFGIVALKSNAGKPWPIPGIIKATSSLTIDAIANQTYTGSALTPAVVVKDGATTMTLGTHYSVTYTNNRNIGIATVTITGKGN
jgi:antibiotic biosynthesis monooxygenase (ABM) superfamily enzyme